jgi:hypothetical protein
MKNWDKQAQERIARLLHPVKCKFVGFDALGDRIKSIPKQDFQEFDLILGYDKTKRVYFAWNAHVLRLINRDAESQSVKVKPSIKIDSIISETSPIYPVYQLHNGGYIDTYTKADLRDKMLIISESFIEEFCKNPFYYLIPSPDDNNFKSDVTFCMPGLSTPLLGEEANSTLLSTDKLRAQYTCNQIARDSRFRKRVLERCGNKCVVCGTAIPCILQAAHIVAVRDDGSDDPRNGVCMCANHHLMFDKGLFEIEKGKIKVLDESIQGEINNGKNLSEYFK